MHLSDFGIKTLGYFSSSTNERYALHIDGNADDESTSANEDVLMSMITNDPETVTKFFTGLAMNLYTTTSSMMGSNDISSMYKVFNDKQISKDLTSYEEKIAAAEEALKAYEDKWYSKFSAMETALSKMSAKADEIGRASCRERVLRLV